jgi:hypothetical protein
MHAFILAGRFMAAAKVPSENLGEREMPLDP